MTILLIRDGDAFECPERLPVLPLRDVVMYPHVVMPLLVGRAASLAAVAAAEGGAGLLFLVAQKNADVQEPSASDLFRVGVVARLLQVQHLPTGTTKLLVEGLGRARVTRYAGTGGASPGTHLRATLEALPLGQTGDENERVHVRRLVTVFEEYLSLQRRVPAEVLELVHAAAESPERQSFAVAAHVGVRLEARQKLLESPSVGLLAQELTRLIAAEVDLLRLERKIEEDVRGSLVQNQRGFYLQEQLKAIHRELGQDEADDLDELETQIETKRLPATAAERARREIRKLKRTSPLSPEASVSRNYVDWLLALPWTERTDDVLDVAHARQVLDEDHYGLDEVKDRVLDYIAVLGLVGRLDGPVLCLTGPPGVGKTSLARSVARALGRRFARMSLGGVRDEAEIRGHRRTYVGALPGRILQAMRRAEVVNPVILLDEVDKLGQDWRGDPSAALLEVLDPEQNRSFNDHYLEVDYDLSQVLFITTANSLASIPDPLRDRMEIIRLPGYLDQEKLAIARRHLVPRQLRQHGIEPERVTWSADALPGIMRGYTREAGVRDLERRIARIARKLARRLAELPDAALTVTAGDLRDMLGVPPHDTAEASTQDRVGVANGLAYTASGGEILEIEVSVVRGRGRLQLTGTLGDVMKESATAALSYTRTRADELGLPADFHRTRDLHVHVPDGATPKDGPSAGIAIATAIISALTGRPVCGHVAMTGEITLRGRVLPIGGLKEKAVAAHRNGIHDVVIPRRNLPEVEELPPEVRETVRFHAAESMDEVLSLVLRELEPLPRERTRPTIGAEEPAPRVSRAH
jgi:ATP-dependent Lon protease